MRKSIKNYTSTVPVARTISNIEELIVKRMKARQFFKEYDNNGEIKSIIFVLPTDKGDLPFKLPARVNKLEQFLLNEKRKNRAEWRRNQIQLTDTEKSQAKITAWKNVHDWIDAQIALIETEQVKTEEVFLPYLTNQSGVTLFEIMEKNQFALPSGESQEGEVIDG